MNFKLRSFIYRFPLFHKICRYFVRMQNLFWYHLHSENINKLKALKDINAGKRCFIIGNGPSLTVRDLEKLTNEDCFAMNYIFKIFRKTKWRPNYYITQDAFGVPCEYINTIGINNLFIGVSYRRKNKRINKNAIFFYNAIQPFSKNVSFSDNASKIIYDSGTVTYSAIQIAVYMGYSEIYLIGVDTDFALKLDKNGNIIKGNIHSSHFYQDEFPDQVIYNEEMILKGYLSAKKYCDSKGIKIMNATRGGKLEIFDRIDLDSLF